MITRFAPSPTGPLHLGHALSALSVWQLAADLGGVALLRIEDTDSTRCRPKWEAMIYDDLAWLGVEWPAPVLRQSSRRAVYQSALDQLGALGLIYPCRCTRADQRAAGALPGVEGLIYPGTCRSRPLAAREDSDALRLDLRRAAARLPAVLTHHETATAAGTQHTSLTALISGLGDPVLWRKDTGDPAYHLACVVDDAAQGVTHVVRGTDLQAMTPLHVALQQLLGLPTPLYHHHRLITDETGQRLAKINHARSLQSYRASGHSPAEIKQMINWGEAGPSA